MAKQNWKALQVEYIRVNAKTGISVADWCKKKGLNFATAKRYIKKPETVFSQQKNCEINCETAKEENQIKTISYKENCEVDCESISETAKFDQDKCEKVEKHSQIDEKTAKEFAKRASHSAKVTKHGGYARYFKDKSAFDVVVDFGLRDEIDLMRQRAISAIESIEKFTALLEKAETLEDKEIYVDFIKSAENALERAVGRIESLSGTDNQIALTLATIELRKAQTKKTLIEADKLEQELNRIAMANDKVIFVQEF